MRINEEKIENDDVFRYDHRIKSTQPIPMILVLSFFAEENVLSDEIKICYILDFKVTKIEHSTVLDIRQGGPQLKILACCMAKNLDIVRECMCAAGVQGLLKGPESSGIVCSLMLYKPYILNI